MRVRELDSVSLVCWKAEAGTLLNIYAVAVITRLPCSFCRTPAEKRERRDDAAIKTFNAWRMLKSPAAWRFPGLAGYVKRTGCDVLVPGSLDAVALAGAFAAW